MANGIESILRQIHDHGRVARGTYDIPEWFEVVNVHNAGTVSMEGVHLNLLGSRLYNCISFRECSNTEFTGFTIHANGHLKQHTCDRRGSFNGGGLVRRDVMGNMGVCNLNKCEGVTISRSAVYGAVTDAFFVKGGTANEYRRCLASGSYSPNGLHRFYPLDFKYRPNRDNATCKFTLCASVMGNGGFAAQDNDTNAAGDPDWDNDRFRESQLTVDRCYVSDAWWAPLYNEGVEHFVGRDITVINTTGHIPRHGCKLTGNRLTELINCRMEQTFIHGGEFRSRPGNPVEFNIEGGRYSLHLTDEEIEQLGRWNSTQFRYPLAMFDGITHIKAGTAIETNLENPFFRRKHGRRKGGLMVRRIDHDVTFNGTAAVDLLTR